MIMGMRNEQMPDSTPYRVMSVRMFVVMTVVVMMVVVTVMVIRRHKH